MTLNDLLELIPEDKRDLPICVLCPYNGYSFEVVESIIENDEYISIDPPPPVPMSEATRFGEHILIDYYGSELKEKVAKMKRFTK